jgi:hypothetical protein
VGPATCRGGVAFTSEDKGEAVCDLEIGTKLGPASFAIIGGEQTVWGGYGFRVIP